MSRRLKRKKITGFEGYLDKALSVGGLVGAWMQDERSGAVSYDSSANRHHGAYTGVTLGQPGVPGMGMTSPLYDGLNDFNNIYGAGLANDNLLLNPGFETAGATWANWTDTVGDGVIANEVVIVHEGTDAAKLTSGPTRNTRTIQAGIVVVPGTRYRLRFWAYGDGAKDIRYRVYDVTNAVSIIGVTPSGCIAAAWAMCVAEFTAPVGCVQIRIEFWGGNGNGAVGYVDACEVRRMDGILGDQGTIIAWAQVAAGAWVDGITRYMFMLSIPGFGSYVNIVKTVAVNTVIFTYKAGGVTESQITAGLTSLNFVPYGITWDISAGATGEVRYYVDGIPGGAVDVALGTWIGDLSVTQTVIGAASTLPGSIWSGPLAPLLVFNEAKSPAEMLYLSTP